MKIISIDVGIKNLAYCLLECADEDTTINKLKILQWDSINLCAADPLIACCVVCKKKAKYYYYPPSEAAGASEAGASEAAAQSEAEEASDADKIYVCSTHSKKIETKYDIIVEKKASANKMDLVSIGIAIKKAFDERFTGNDAAAVAADHIVIENQISPIATRMKTIQGMLMQYFIMQGIPSITFASAINKLKAFTDKKKKISYKERKKLGIDVTAHLIKETQSLAGWSPYFKTHQKQDDLADSFLQGIWYLQSIKKLAEIKID
jgi:hypothetical protein